MSIAMEEYELMKDSKYRMYVAAIDKALKNFEYTSEWADLISALGKLNKVLLGYTKYSIIPRRIKISKRLAQCMHPALPSGVHLKALETYDIIFKCMKTTRLAQDLFIYSAGLFPLLGHAAMNIRPTLLTIYENHFVPLKEHLRPALIGFLSGVLPGLETGSDHFERTNSLLESICEGVGPRYFYTCIWHCVTNNSPVRLHAISYVLSHYNKKWHMEEQLELMGHDIDLMVGGLCAAVQDSSVLVQRSALDLLMSCFPMHNGQLLYADMMRLVTAALSTILRRDMSLNRRLYSWLLESESSHPVVQSEDTDKHPTASSSPPTLTTIIPPESARAIAYDLLIDAIRIILRKSTTDIPLDVKPYRLLTSLFDKPQIGPIILDTILYDVFRALYSACLNMQKHESGSTVRCVSFNGDLTSLKAKCGDGCGPLSKQFVAKRCQELVKNANLLFNTLQSYYIWSYIEKLYGEAVNTLAVNSRIVRDMSEVNEIGSGSPGILEICILTDFLLDVVPIESDILPSLFSKIVLTLERNMEIVNHHEVEESLRLCTKILAKIQPITMTSQAIDDSDVSKSSFSVVAGESSEREVKTSLEKSKSDSKINENLSKNSSELTIDDARERSYSNQMLVNNNNSNATANSNKKKDKNSPSPRIDKKSKNKKSKSSSKLYEGFDSSSLEIDQQPIESTPPPIPKTTTPPTRLIENRHFVRCLHEYKRLYVTFVKTKILPATDLDNFLEKLSSDKDERTNRLIRLLEESLNRSDDFRPMTFEAILAGNNDAAAQDDLLRVAPSEARSDFEGAVGVASNLLLEFSAFPNLTRSSFVERHDDGSSDADEILLPDWLKAIIVAALCKKSSREIQMQAMSALLEIFSLAKNRQPYQCKDKRQEDCNTNILITGILEREYVDYVEKHTAVVEEMSQILWNMLGVLTNQKQLLLCVTLLYQIHNTFDSKSFVEQVIGKYLSSDYISVEYMKQFFLLWHLGRDLTIKLPPSKPNIRNFDRSLLKILDHLQNADKPHLRLLSETFLSHALLHGDIPRIINPVLTKLLTPNTARVLIKHVNINDGDQSHGDLQSSADDRNRKLSAESQLSKKIYAVSSENGNIMYHLADTDGDGRKPTAKRKWFTFTSKSNGAGGGGVSTGGGGTKKYNITSTMNEYNNVVTSTSGTRKGIGSTTSVNTVKKATTPKSESGSSGKGSKGGTNVKLIINPLSSKEVYADGVDGSYSKLDSGGSRRSSSESLSSSNDYTPTGVEKDSIQDRDSGYDSFIRTKSELLSNSKLLESLEPISDGIKAIDHTYSLANIPKSRSFDEKSSTLPEAADLSLVHSWSYCMSDSDNLNAELELSTSAEDFFKKNPRDDDISEIVNDLVDLVCGLVDNAGENDTTKRPTDLDLTLKASQHKHNHASGQKSCVLYPMHSHICLYYDIFDSNQVLYALQILKSCIDSDAQLFIKCMATSGVKNLRNPDVLTLLARHRKSLMGGGFVGDVATEQLNFYRGYTFLDVIISLCSNFARTFYPSFVEDDLHNVVTGQELSNNLRIQLDSLEILDVIVRNLVVMVTENSRGFSRYIADMLVKCKLQKILLHCLLISVRNFDEDMSFAEEILLFNNFRLYDSKHRVGENVEAFQIQLLRLIHSLIILEYHVFPTTPPAATSQQDSAANLNADHMNYTPTVLIPQQNIFSLSVMSALRHRGMKTLHEKWLHMVTSCLPYFGENLRDISIKVIHQICNNIEEIASRYNQPEVDGEPCCDYAVTQLESLTILCHYCLLDATQTVNQMNVPNNGGGGSVGVAPPNPSDILNNLVSAFFAPVGLDLNFLTNSTKHNSDHYQLARKTILSHMPRIISSVAKLWQTVVNLEDGGVGGVFGNTRVVKQQLLEFLSPISVHHGASFLAAIAVAWYERRNLFPNIKTVLPEPNAGQNNLVYLISAIRVIPLDNLVQTVTAVIKNPPPIEGVNTDICLDVYILELFYCYMRNASPTQLSEAWGSLLALIREGCVLSPPAQFLLAALLHELMIKCCPMEDRKDQKDLQDVTAKLIECVSQVCGSCLEQTTWLRRNLAVKEHDDEDSISDGASIITGASSETLTNSVGNSHSVQAQFVLSEILAPILDICFGSSEKDKVTTILTSLMYNIVPYLKTHTVKNMPSFHACSKLLASLSSYQYTRKAWKKDVFDLLLDNSVFQMDYSCLKYWRTIVDNLMTHDTTTFRDLMSRVSMTQSGSLSIFSSREQEYEQRSQLLKRLAYVIFCSEMDQYAKYMPDIQEQLTTSLRLNVPGVQAQVFACFRVILIRMSPLHVTSLWPIIISEMLQVFLQIELQLMNDSEEFKTSNSFHIKMLSSLDASWSTNSSNGLHALGHPHWLRLQLATAKLLDLALLLPAVSLPQFQMYRWAFVGDDLERLHSPNTASFLPHVLKITELMDRKFTDTSIDSLPMKRNELLLTMNSINKLKDLHGFFKTLSQCSNRHRTECHRLGPTDHYGTITSNTSASSCMESNKANVVVEKIDKVIEMDFLDKIPR